MGHDTHMKEADMKSVLNPAILAAIAMIASVAGIHSASAAPEHDAAEARVEVASYYRYAWGFTRHDALRGARELECMGYRICSRPYRGWVREIGGYAWKVDVSPY